MNLYEILQNSGRVGEGMTHFERLFAQKVGGGKINEISGVPPLRYIGDGRPLTDYLISGNAVQDGTPSSDVPVDATGCGVRTGNLFDASNTLNGARIGAVGEVVSDFSCVLSGYIPVLPNESYSQSTRFSYSNALVEFDENKEFIKRYVSGSGKITTSENTRFIRVSCAKTLVGTFMLNLGSTALPYEPYGYKLPLTVNGTEYPIYLGQVETTRRIKKLVLTGEETWSIYGGGKQFQLIFSSEAARNNLFVPVSNCYKGTQVSGWNDLNDKEFSISPSSRTTLRVCDPRYENDLSAFKSYLAAQYAAGTPVTVWYVLATPETAIVNEPLMKIGDYADTVSFAQAGVTIPTVDGENVLDVPTTVPPSEVWIRGRIKEV